MKHGCDQAFIVKRFSVQNGDQADGISLRIPERHAGIALGLYLGQEMVARKKGLDFFREKAKAFPHDLFAGSAGEAVFDVRGQCPFSIDAHGLDGFPIIQKACQKGVIGLESFAQIPDEWREKGFSAQGEAVLRNKTQGPLNFIP